MPPPAISTATAKLDLVGTGGNRVIVLLGSGNGTFQVPMSYAAGEHPQAVAIGDFDGDGKPDLAVRNFGSSTMPATSTRA